MNDLPALPTIAGLLLIAGLAVPCLLALRGPRVIRDRQQAAIALHRARLAAIGQEQAAGLIAPEERDAARLEIQRQLLAEADRTTSAPPAGDRRGDRIWLIGGALAIPLASLALYLVVGYPALPSAPLALRLEAQRTDPQARRDAELVTALRARVAGLDPASPQGIAGLTLLGRVEATQEHWAEAAAASHRQISIRTTHSATRANMMKSESVIDPLTTCSRFGRKGFALCPNPTRSQPRGSCATSPPGPRGPRRRRRRSTRRPASTSTASCIAAPRPSSPSCWSVTSPPRPACWSSASIPTVSAPR